MKPCLSIAEVVCGFRKKHLKSFCFYRYCQIPCFFSFHIRVTSVGKFKEINQIKRCLITKRIRKKKRRREILRKRGRAIDIDMSLGTVSIGLSGVPSPGPSPPWVYLPNRYAILSNVAGHQCLMRSGGF